MNPPPADSPKSQATEKAELLPCPWCGRAPRHYIEYGIVTLGCSNTKCHMMPVTAPKLSMETAVEFWNRRCAPPSNAALLASLKETRDALKPFADFAEALQAAGVKAYGQGIYIVGDSSLKARLEESAIKKTMGVFHRANAAIAQAEAAK